jgi:CTP synthase
MGGTMRLGAYPCELAGGRLAQRCHGISYISERHRHRYEFNNDFREDFEKNGMRLSGLSPDGRLVEIVEIPGNPFFAAVQFHPEFKSRPNHPHPLFTGLITAVEQTAAQMKKDKK